MKITAEMIKSAQGACFKHSHPEKKMTDVAWVPPSIGLVKAMLEAGFAAHEQSHKDSQAMNRIDEAHLNDAWRKDGKPMSFQRLKWIVEQYETAKQNQHKQSLPPEIQEFKDNVLDKIKHGDWDISTKTMDVE